MWVALWVAQEQALPHVHVLRPAQLGAGMQSALRVTHDILLRLHAVGPWPRRAACAAWAPPARARARAQVEQALLAAAPYPQFCLTAYNGSAALGCAAPTSLLAFLYAPAAAAAGGVVGYGADLAPGLAQAAAFMAADPAAFGFFFDTGFAPGNLSAAYVRSLVPLGAPLAGYASPADRRAARAAPRAHACPGAPCRRADGRWVRPPCSRAAACPV